MTPFKSYFKTFLLLHVILGIILLAGYGLVLGQTGEIFAYAFLFALIFGLIATLVQSGLFSIIAYFINIDRLFFFFIVFILELALANFIINNSNSGDNNFTFNLIKNLRSGDTTSEVMGSLIIHISILASTILISLIRSPYKSIDK